MADKDDTPRYTHLKVLVLLIAGHESAIELSQVKEILPAVNIEYLPNAITPITGILNVRGDILPIVDLKYFLSEYYRALDANSSNPRIVLVESDHGPHGLMVASVLRVKDGLWETHAPSHSLKSIQQGNILFTKAITNTKGYSLPVLDIQSIIAYISSQQALKGKQNSIQT